MIVGVNDHGLPIYDGDVEPRVLGTLPPPPGFMLAAAGADLLPESQWVEFDYADRPGFDQIAILDQDGKGACVGHATAMAMMIARWLSGQEYVPLSPWFLYAILCNGFDRGASISQALDLATKTGTCPFADVAYATINPNRLTADNKAKAAKYRIELGGATPSFEQMMSETQRGNPGNFSIGVGGGFNRLDGDGVPPSTGMLNHSVCYGLGAKKAKNGEWLLKCRNSWNTTWGLHGDFYIRKSNIYRGNDSWSISAVIDAPDDPTNPPVAS